jgi:hypothetical protein
LGRHEGFELAQSLSEGFREVDTNHLREPGRRSD